MRLLRAWGAAAGWSCKAVLRRGWLDVTWWRRPEWRRLSIQAAPARIPALAVSSTSRKFSRPRPDQCSGPKAWRIYADPAGHPLCLVPVLEVARRGHASAREAIVTRGVPVRDRLKGDSAAVLSSRRARL